MGLTHYYNFIVQILGVNTCYCFTVLYCIVLCHTVLYCAILYDTVPYCIVLCHTVWYCIILCHIVLYCTILYYTVPYCIVLSHTVLYCIILCHTVLYCTILYYTLPYCTILHWVFERPQIALVLRYFEVFGKLIRACFYQIAVEIILLSLEVRIWQLEIRAACAMQRMEFP